MNSQKELARKVAIITGSARNLGRAYSVALAKMGANIVVHYHDADTKKDAEETVKLIEDTGSKTILVEGDLTNLSVIKKLFEETIKAFGKVDIVINNAGVVIKKLRVTRKVITDNILPSTPAFFQKK